MAFFRGPSIRASMIAACVLGFLPAAHSLASELPPQECVRLLRAARIARLSADSQQELAKIQRARASCPHEVLPVFALLDWQRRHGRDDALIAELVADLVARLADPDSNLRVGVVQQLVSDPQLDGQAQELLADHLEARTAVAENEAAPEASADAADPRLLDALAELQQRLGRPEAAAVTRERLWRQTGSEEQLWPLIQDLRLLGRWDEAAGHLSTLVASGTLGARPLLLDSLMRAQRFEALAAQAELLEEDLQGGEADSEVVTAVLRELAWRSRDVGRDDVARRLFQRVVAIDGSNGEARAALLHLYGSAQEQADHAAEIAERWEEESDPQMLINQGAQLLSTGDARGAFDLLQRAAPQLPQMEAGWYNLGMAAYKIEDWATAEEAFSKAAVLNPKRAPSPFFRGMALVKLERCAEAIQPLLTAVKLDPERAQAHYYLADCYRELGNLEESERHRALYDAARD
jgi:tetratricopeptide (TPR) repeat protein